MPIANYTALRSILENDSGEIVSLNLAQIAAGANQAPRLFDCWNASLIPGLAPTLPVVPTRTTTGAFGQQDGGTGQLGIIGAEIAGHPGLITIADRLSHQAGLSGIVTTPQTTNLPTAALTRYTSGVGVFIALTIYTVVGTTATTVSVSYTNSAGVSGRTTPPMLFGGSLFREARRFLWLPLQSGDIGVRSVQNVTVLASTGTAGNFGVTLFKPLWVGMIEHNQATMNIVNGYHAGLIPEVVNGACLFQIISSTFNTAQNSGYVLLSEH